MKRNTVTRKSLKLKIIGGASALFIAVALIATGFSAWIISSNANVEANLGVSVATVSTSTLKIEIDNLDENGNLNQELRFESVKGDKGRVGYQDETGEGKSENLTIILSGEVDNAQHMQSLFVTVDLTNTNLAAAQVKGYITLPTTGDNSTVELVNLTGEKTSLEGVENGYILIAKTDENGNYVYEHGYQVFVAKFILVLTFGWGEQFDYVNPCYYYDGVDGNGNYLADRDQILLKTTEQIKEELLTFKEIIEGEKGAGNINLTVKTKVK